MPESKMLILAFDTTSPDGSIVLFRDLEQLGEVRSDGKSNYSVALFEMVDRLLGGGGATLAEVELFAAATGPGSFTGIRVGLAAAQAWAKAFGRPVLGVSVLEAMVGAARPHAKVAIPLLDARRAEFYLGVFSRQETGDAEESRFTLAGEGRVLSAVGVAALVEDIAQSGDAEVDLVARDGDQSVFDLRAQLPSWVKWSTVSSYLAASIARLAWRAAREGHLQHPEELDALYIRRSDAEVNWRE
jgi:tRNA threonylcarbamoyladenosine biosynthesis protein TsaB